jgi:hypothetical protein
MEGYSGLRYAWERPKVKLDLRKGAVYQRQPLAFTLPYT